MRISLNSEQAKGLANFLFDVAKGLVLGGIGLSLTTPFEVKILAIFSSSIFAAACLIMALKLLEDFK